MQKKVKSSRSDAFMEDALSLRQKAEEWLDHADKVTIPVRSAEEVLHELQVHQIELEMQNETLRHTLLELEESRDNWIGFYDFAPVGYLTLNRDTLIVDINLTGATLLGDERSKLLSRRFSNYISPSCRGTWHQHIMSVLQNDGKQSCELELLRVNKTRMYIQLESLRLKKSSGAYEVRNLLLDITKRREIEESHRISAEEFRDIYNNAPCGYHSLDKNGIFRRINDTELGWLGYERDEVIGKLKWLDVITPASRITFQENFPQFIKNKFVNDLEFEMIRKDGTTLVGLVNATAILDSNGDFLMSRSTVFDITSRKNLEANLVESENRRHLLEQQEIVQTSLDGFWVVNSKSGKILEINDMFCKMTGYTREEILSMEISDFEAIETPEETKARIKKVLEVGYDRFETRHRHKQGHLIDFEVSVSHSEVKGGVNFAFFRDITERNRILDSLKKSEENYRILFENSRDAMVTAMGVTPYCFITVNLSAVQLFGANKTTELIGYKPWELSPEYQPDGMPSNVKAALMIEAAVKNGFHFFEWTHKRIDGRTFPAEILLTRFELEGQSSIQATIRDISDRKSAEAVVKQSRDQLLTFIHQTPISVAMFDRNMNYLAVSGRWMSDFSRGYSTLIGLNHYAVHPDIPDDWKAAHQQALAGSSIEKNDDMWVHKDGTKQWLRWAIIPWIDEHEEIGGIIISTENITDSKILEIEMSARRNEMEQLQKMHIAAQTASAIAHEMNQPLLAIASYSQAALMMMAARKPDYGDVRIAIEKSEQQALRAGRSIRDLIEFLSIKDFTVDSFDINKEIVEILGTAKSEHNLQFRSVLKLEEGLPLVRANRTHVQKVLFNLLHNGIDAMQSAGVPLPAITVTVATSKDNCFAQLTIQDNGPGIRKEDIHRLFEPFFTTKAKGIGMGLAISRSLIEENGGQLWVDPQEGPGATFHLTLPLAI